MNEKFDYFDTLLYNKPFHSCGEHTNHNVIASAIEFLHHILSTYGKISNIWDSSFSKSKQQQNNSRKIVCEFLGLILSQIKQDNSKTSVKAVAFSCLSLLARYHNKTFREYLANGNLKKSGPIVGKKKDIFFYNLVFFLSFFFVFKKNWIFFSSFRH